MCRAPVPKPRRRGAGDWALIGAAAALALLSALTFVREMRRPAPMPAWSNTLLGAVAPFRSVSGYGLFRSMTTERPEIVIEGSADGTTWREYPFRWKAGALSLSPRFVQPHMPRLDWQMWFAALDPQRQAHWLLPPRPTPAGERPAGPRVARRGSQSVPGRAAAVRAAAAVPLSLHDTG